MVKVSINLKGLKIEAEGPTASQVAAELLDQFYTALGLITDSLSVKTSKERDESCEGK